MLNKIKSLFQKPQTEDELLISRIKTLPKNEFYISKLEEYLKKANFENINIQDGEYYTMNKSVALECCLDVFFEKDFLYSLSIYEDGVVLFKNKNKLEKVDGYLIEDIDSEEIYKFKFEKSIIKPLRAVCKIA